MHTAAWLVLLAEDKLVRSNTLVRLQRHDPLWLLGCVCL